MAGSSSKTSLQIFTPSRQVGFHQLLVGARKAYLVDALQEALKQVDPKVLRRQLSRYVPRDVQVVLASAGIRDEYAFPVPTLLEAQPTLVGYYRLLLGISQKMSYRTGTGMGAFKSMEMGGSLSPAQQAKLPAFCKAMSAGLAELVCQLSPAVTRRDLNELPLLTLGSQFQGSSNVAIGKQATLETYLAITEIVDAFVEKHSAKQVKITNASGRTVVISLGADPDVRIQEEFGGELRNKVAIEIKGGTDMSNVHNRAGEAEKSHQKAKAQGYRDFWTIILKKGVSAKKLKAESPTTTSWFDTAEVLGREGADWEEFRTRLAGEVGIPVT